MALTKVTGGTISTTSNYEVGVITATKFVGPFEGSVTGVATGASKVITSDESSDTTCFPLFVNSSTDAYQAPKLGSNLTFNSSTGDLGATKVTAEQFVGNISGTGATFTTLDVSGTLNYTHVTDVYSVGVATFQNNVQVGAGISVVGVSTFTNGVGIADSIFHIGDTDTFMKYNSNEIVFETGAASKVFINDDGDLTVGASEGNLGKVYIKQAADTDTEGLTLLNSGSTNSFRVFLGDTSGTVAHIGHGGQKQFNITQAGLVGIGNTAAGFFSVANNLVVGSGGGSEGMTIYSDSTNDGYIVFADGTSDPSYRMGQIIYSHNTDTMQFRTGGNTERLRIRNDGNVVAANDLAVTGVTTSSDYDLSAISTTISDTAVDIFVYDTRKDSDGGAWRKRTSHTTWYNEAFGAKRGSKKEFPAVAVIVAEVDKLTIYDGDKPEMPMWMVFDSGGANGNHMAGRSNEDTTSIHMLNGLLCIGRDYFGLHMINFIDDRARFKENGYDTPYTLPIGTHRNGSNTWALNPTNEGNDLRNDMVNDIAMTVLPDAPIDSSTGLPVPTIAVATDIGVSIIRHTANKETGTTTWENGMVADVYDDNGTYDNVNNVQFTKDGKVVYTEFKGGTTQFGWMYVHDIPYKDTAVTVNNQDTALSWYDTRDDGTNGHGFADIDGHIYSSTASYGVKILHAVTGPDDMIYTSTTSGVTMIQENRGANRSALVAHVTHLYNTGWLHGDQKFCLSDTDDTNKTNTQTEYDRSIAAKNLTVHGTVTKTAVATGAEMVSWSFGDSNSNYLKQAYNAQLQFGTGDFSVMGWIKMADYSDSGYIFDRADSSTGNRIAVFVGGDRTITLYTNDGATTEVGSGGNAVIGSAYDGKWVFFTVTRHSSGAMEAYLHGELKHSVVGTSRNVDNNDAYLIVGGRHNNASGEQFDGEIALLRISKSVPSPEQVAKIYNDEKDLFIPNAKCSLYGSSSSITALAHDEDTDTLHVGTSGGRSDFIGLNRINNTTTAVTTAISASNGLIIEQ